MNQREGLVGFLKKHLILEKYNLINNLSGINDYWLGY